MASPAALPATYTVLHDFIGTDGRYPEGGLLRDTTGNLYGVTVIGGSGCSSSGGCGVIYKLSPPSGGETSWPYAVLHYFSDGVGGNMPLGGLVADSNGNFYGTTSSGGSGANGVGGSGNGVIFKLSAPPAGKTAWSYNVIHNFGLAINGAGPTRKLLLSASGALYGTTGSGGSGSVGVIFKLTPPASGQTGWSYAVLHNFAPSSGRPPTVSPSGLIADAKGTLYGVTGNGGSSNLGTVFSLTPPGSGQTAWTYTVIHNFGFEINGSLPNDALLLGQNGSLYGVTILGGPPQGCEVNNSNSCGVIYELAPPAASSTRWTYTKIHTLRNFAAGMAPINSPTQDSKGAIYIATPQGGTTSCNGEYGCGVIFRLQPPSNSTGELTEDRLHIFGKTTYGYYPNSSLLLDSEGALYGTTLEGGRNKNGVIYEFNN